VKLKQKITIAEHFKDIDDPRIERSKLHKLTDIITIAICAVICGADTWEDIELFGDAKYEWFKEFLELSNGIPSHDTFARVFSRIEPKQFQECFLNWVKCVEKLTDGTLVAIDGKTLRHSYDAKNEKAAIHMVSAWNASQRLVLGQVKVDEKSNEITAIPELLNLLSLKGCIVTIDAMACQKDIVNKIVEKGGDYVISLKKNQNSLYQKVEELFKQAITNKYEGFSSSTIRVSEPAHGRNETRYCVVLSNVKELIDPEGKWDSLCSVGMIDFMRTSKGKTKLETRYFISSLPNDAELLAQSIRGHWNIENQLHWVLDVAFHEDDCRIRKDNAPQNFAILRQIALNLLNQETTLKKGVKRKRNKAGWDNEYLAQLLAGIYTS
jgi:predicted transposase YbfD/YdcC